MGKCEDVLFVFTAFPAKSQTDSPYIYICIYKLLVCCYISCCFVVAFFVCGGGGGMNISEPVGVIFSRGM